ncbi:hypothetical protein ACEQ8H_007600 [Pleosporales sp. CAS-2024a]
MQATSPTTPPPPADQADDDDAAAQQIQDEVRASASQRAPHAALRARASAPQSSAMVGANLLNAARIEYRHSNPVRAVSKPRHGKLSHVSIFTEPRRHDGARPRAHDVYDLSDESPETAPVKLSVRRNPPSSEQAKEHLVPSMGTVSEEPMPSSPPQFTQSDAHGVPVESLRHGASRCTAVSYRKDKAGTRYEQCRNAGSHATDQGPRCPRHNKKPGSIRCTHMTLHHGDVVQCRMPAVQGTATCSRHTAPATSSKRRKLDDDAQARAGPGQPVQAQRQTRASHTTDDSAEAASSVEKWPAPTSSQAASGRRQKMSQKGQKVQSANASENDVPSDVQGNGSSVPGEGHGDIADDAEQTSKSDGEDGQASGEEDDGNAQTSEISRALGRAFKFLEMEKRSGQCQTELCASIKTTCDMAGRQLRRHDLEASEMAEVAEKLRAALDQVRDVAHADRLETKADMYGYIFRSVTRTLKSLHDECCWHKGAETLEAMRIMMPLVRQILLVKDLITSWKVPVPQGHDGGDCFIKQVNSELIAPLRRAEVVLRKKLGQLESEERAGQEMTQSQERFEATWEEDQRQTKLAAERRERWIRWQQLHIARMQCEPDARKRLSRLRIIDLGDLLEETDANGIVFQRLPVFKDRQTPLPRRHNSTVESLRRPWLAEQEEALLDGLQKFAGPNVFQDIFKAFCRPSTGGLLRDFSVLDIVCKAAELRHSITILYEENGWNLAEWVRQIPVLP